MDVGDESGQKPTLLAGLWLSHTQHGSFSMIKTLLATHHGLLAVVAGLGSGGIGRRAVLSILYTGTHRIS